jgi:large conductance mechanosensitive channel
MRGFRDFILRGNLVELAVAFVVGAAFTALVTAFVQSFLTPLIALIFGKPDFTALSFDINGTTFPYGIFVTALISFLSIAAVVYYFVVTPYNHLQERFAAGAKDGDVDTTKSCTFCATAIPFAATRCPNCTSELGADTAA